MVECRCKGQCRIEYDTDFDVFHPCIGDGSDTCVRYEPVTDVKALLELAGEMDRSALDLLKTNDLDPNRKRRSMRMEHAQDLMAASSRIREALGVKR